MTHIQKKKSKWTKSIIPCCRTKRVHIMRFVFSSISLNIQFYRNCVSPKNINVYVSLLLDKRTLYCDLNVAYLQRTETTQFSIENANGFNGENASRFFKSMEKRAKETMPRCNKGLESVSSVVRMYRNKGAITVSNQSY